MTAQVHERLILDGESVTMNFCPPLPENHPRIYDKGQGGVNTACWRGYVATWEIRDGHLYLVAIQGRYGFREGEPLLAEWFTGELRVPRGKMVFYVHMGFGSRYERELFIQIEKGVVGARREIDPGERMRRYWEDLAELLPEI